MFNTAALDASACSQMETEIRALIIKKAAQAQEYYEEHPEREQHQKRVSTALSLTKMLMEKYADEGSPEDLINLLEDLRKYDPLKED